MATCELLKLLGRYLAAQVGPLDIVMIMIAIVAGAGASATLLCLAYLERHVEFSTLRAVGWPRGSVATVVAIQALVLGLGGGVAWLPLPRSRLEGWRLERPWPLLLPPQPSASQWR